jgi:predicted DNA-binding WGR domain protein
MKGIYGATKNSDEVVSPLLIINTLNHQTMFKLKLQKRKETVIKSENPVTVLQHTKGRSAEYKITIVPVRNNTWDVIAVYGKIGTGLKQQKIGSFNNFAAAKKLYDSKLYEKLKKGYEIISNKL